MVLYTYIYIDLLQIICTLSVAKVRAHSETLSVVVLSPIYGTGRIVRCPPATGPDWDTTVTLDSRIFRVCFIYVTGSAVLYGICTLPREGAIAYVNCGDATGYAY